MERESSPCLVGVRSGHKKTPSFDLTGCNPPLPPITGNGNVGGEEHTPAPHGSDSDSDEGSDSGRRSAAAKPLPVSHCHPAAHAAISPLVIDVLIQNRSNTEVDHYA